MHSPDTTAEKPSLFDQPKAVYAVAFACVISFMGIGLVDPILPALKTQLDATESQVTLLFTSYLVVTAVAMLVTNWFSSRVGAKRTLLIGLVIIVIFSALAGASGSISGIVAFRAGWGLGNALFIATSLAAIVQSARGGFAGAIILYEAALGLGIAAGPLVGGTLGNISWRGPFFGVSVLMAIALVATALLLPSTPKPEHKTKLSAPLLALRHRGLATMSVAALLYNWGFFTMLGYAPFPMALSITQLGWVFFGWGLLVAFFSVIGAPWLQARLGTAVSLYIAFTLFAADLALMATDPTKQSLMVGCVIAAGIFIGINNTLMTQAVMLVSPVERPVASAAYGFVRFIGGGLAPFAAGKLVEHFSVHVPFAIAAVAVLLAAVVLSTAHRTLADADRGIDEDGHTVADADVVEGEVADEFGGAPGAIDELIQSKR
ncbi:MFS transporter [Aeromicrobium sp. Root495]|uniref:MFS transporter n=1 Tax=Aeromicrobium sp. Root495 TaxID=1736550 RepID=UPI0006F4D32D|nr:MFS transporter [Aeromicrobium sp. Root495]KQY59462.1 MFS transporter [Aeromicrobium sp. Root495]RYJ07562.1 MAG: MFS transporter [Actinomycetales bacterium]